MLSTEELQCAQTVGKMGGGTPISRSPCRFLFHCGSPQLSVSRRNQIPTNIIPHVSDFVKTREEKTVSNFTLSRPRFPVIPHKRGAGGSADGQRVAAITALMVCIRFSASSNTMEAGDSNTSSVTSMQSMPNFS